MTERLINRFGYLGIILLLVLGGLGLPVPEEAPIILAAILSKNDKMSLPWAAASCLFGVLAVHCGPGIVAALWMVAALMRRRRG